MRKSYLSNKLLPLIALVVLLVGTMTSTVFGIGFPNNAVAEDPGNFYYAKDKGETLAVYLAGQDIIAADWSFCLDEHAGTPSWNGPGSNPTGTFKKIKNVDEQDLDREFAVSQVGISGNPRTQGLKNPNYTVEQRFQYIKNIIYIMNEDPTGFRNRYPFITKYQMWVALSDAVYNVTNSKDGTDYARGQTDPYRVQVGNAQNDIYRETMELMKKSDLIPANVQVEVDIYESQQRPKFGKKAIQSLITGRVVKQLPQEPKGELKTTVSALGKEASSTKELALTENEVGIAVNVTDKVEYKNLVGNTSYKLTGTLMEVKNGVASKVEGVAPASKTFTTTADGNGVESLTFEGVKLEAGKAYVVYEEAESVNEIEFVDGTKKHKAEHKDPTDKSQTVAVTKETPEKKQEPKGELKTTVSANGNKASDKKEATVEANKNGITVVDKVYYKDLVANEKYVLEGTLKHVLADGTVEDVNGGTIVRKEVVSSNTGNGEWEITFEKVKGLKVGEKYVVFEVATSVENLVDTDGDGHKDSKHIVKHENSKDKAQTFKVVKKEPKGYDTSDETQLALYIMLFVTSVMSLLGFKTRNKLK